MPELTSTAQHWVNVVLIWLGFGCLAGLLARLVLPLREPQGLFATLTLGVTGSAVGLGVLSWTIPGRAMNPISPLGLVAATGGAIVLLAAYALLHPIFHRNSAGGEKAGDGQENT